MNRVAVAASAFGKRSRRGPFLVEVPGREQAGQDSGVHSVPDRLVTRAVDVRVPPAHRGREKMADGVEGGRVTGGGATGRPTFALRVSQVVRRADQPPARRAYGLGVLIGRHPAEARAHRGHRQLDRAGAAPAELAFIAAVAKALFELGVLIGGAALPMRNARCSRRPS